MIVRQDLQAMPPKPFMDQIMDPLAKAYCFLWERKDRLNRINFTWSELSKYYNKNTFRTNLRKLSSVGLVSDIEESAEDISIELVGWDEFEDEV
jgi:hypothetical protein